VKNSISTFLIFSIDRWPVFINGC